MKKYQEVIESEFALQLVATPKHHKRKRKVLLVVALATLVILLLPWQQNIQGKGKLTPYRPEDRPQKVPSLIAGRIVRWNVVEGQFVKAGDTLAVIGETKEKYFDPQLLQRTNDQIRSKEEALASKLEKIESIERQTHALKAGLRFKLEQTKNKLKQVKYKAAAERASYEAAKVGMKMAQDQYQRLENLFNKGLASLTELQNRNVKTQEANSKLVEAENKWNAVQNEVVNSEIELNAVESDYLEKISKAESIINETAGEVFESQAEISKMRIDLSNLSIRNGFYVIRAPQDGYILKAIRSGIGETIKEGEDLVAIAPLHSQMALEWYVRPMDLPLVHSGNKVRVQFDGWPALVFSGWPNAGVGTFAGVIASVDMVNSENGLFRVLVRPDPTLEPWPEQVKAGSGAYAWAMLNRVSIGYELWRLFNGFPPDFYEGVSNTSENLKLKEK